MNLTTKLRVMIIDDEPLARKNLGDLLEEIDQVELIGEASNGFDALRMIVELKPDLLFLDVQMPRISGFDLVEILGADCCPPVVFVTAFDQYALRAFENNAIDYLLKPVNPERLKKALEKAGQLIAGKKSMHWLRPLIETNQHQQAPLKRILIRSGTQITVLSVKEISHFQAEDDYLRIFSGTKSYLKNERLNRLEKLLDCQQFCRVHRSYIVNLQFIQAIERVSVESRILRLKNGVIVPVSRDGYRRLKNLLG